MVSIPNELSLFIKILDHLSIMPRLIIPSSAAEYTISVGVPKMKSKVFDYFNVHERIDQLIMPSIKEEL